MTLSGTDKLTNSRQPRCPLLYDFHTRLIGPSLSLILPHISYVCQNCSVLDASGLGDSGYMTRLAAEFGDYDQCLDVDAQRPARGAPFVGQYCMFRVHFPLPARRNAMPDKVDISSTAMHDTWLDKTTYYYKFFYYDQLSASLCFPSACTANELEPVMQSCKHQFTHNLTFNLLIAINLLHQFSFIDLRGLRSGLGRSTNQYYILDAL